MPCVQSGQFNTVISLCQDILKEEFSRFAKPEMNSRRENDKKMSVLFIDPVSRSKSGICSETKGRRGRQEAE